MRELKQALPGPPPCSPPTRGEITSRQSESDALLLTYASPCTESVYQLGCSARLPLSQMRWDEGMHRLWDGSFDGGNSRASEVMCFWVLRTRGAELVGAEKEIEYTEPCPQLDMAINTDGELTAVSVTRVYPFAKVDQHTVDALLARKLDGLKKASKCAAAEWQPDSQVLFVWVATKEHAELVAHSWSGQH